MPQWIGEVVGNHFRFAGSAAGEIHQRDVVVLVGVFRLCERSGIGYAFMKVLKSFGYFRTYADQFLYTRRTWHGSGDVVGNDTFTCTDNHFDVCGIATIYNILLSKQVCGGNNNRAQFVQCDDAEPEFITAFENQHYHITMSNAEALEIGGCHICITFHVGK